MNKYFDIIHKFIFCDILFPFFEDEKASPKHSCIATFSFAHILFYAFSSPSHFELTPSHYFIAFNFEIGQLQ